MLLCSFAFFLSRRKSTAQLLQRTDLTFLWILNRHRSPEIETGPWECFGFRVKAKFSKDSEAVITECEVPIQPEVSRSPFLLSVRRVGNCPVSHKEIQLWFSKIIYELVKRQLTLEMCYMQCLIFTHDHCRQESELKCKHSQIIPGQH